jgi:hypothetical protein
MARRRRSSTVPLGLPRVLADPPWLHREQPAASPEAADLLDLPDRIPRLPQFYKDRVHPAPVLSPGRVPLPPEAVRHLATMLCFSPVDPPYAGLRQVAAACEPSSLTEFVWSIFSAWHAAGGPPAGYWAVHALGHLGGDEAMRRLAAVVAKLSPARAEVALEAFAIHGSNRSLMYLQRLAHRGRSPKLRQAAAQTIERIARLRGLDQEEVEDRLVPDLEVEPDGSLTLDYGPRKLRVVLGAELEPTILDPTTGQPLRGLPPVRSTDDDALAKEATRRFKALKKDAGVLARSQAIRLERAMCRRRRWDAETFCDCLLGHPLLVHLVRRLVWLRLDASGGTSFRVADRTIVDVVGTQLDLGGAEVNVAHPLLLPEAHRERWSAIFAAEGIQQPFPQLEREAFTWSEAERQAVQLRRVEGRKIAAAVLLGLDARGWEKNIGPGRIDGYRKPLPAGAWAHLPFAPGLPLDQPAEAPEQTLGVVTLGGAASFGALHPVDFSELVRDLVQL